MLFIARWHYLQVKTSSRLVQWVNNVNIEELNIYLHVHVFTNIPIPANNSNNPILSLY